MKVCCLKKYREEAGLSQSGLAKKLGVSRGLVSQWEQGVINISAERLAVLSKLLDVPASEIVQETDRQPPQPAEAVPSPENKETAQSHAMANMSDFFSQLQRQSQQLTIPELEQSIKLAHELIQTLEMQKLVLATRQFTSGRSTLSEEELLREYQQLLRKRAPQKKSQ